MEYTFVLGKRIVVPPQKKYSHDRLNMTDIVQPLTETIPQGLLFQEHYDMEVMDHILRHPDGYSKRDIQNLSRYHRARANKNRVDVTYVRRGIAAKNLAVGRLYPKDGLGLQSFPFDIRNPLLEKYYHDCDMVNAHYVLLAALADKWGMKCESIKYYLTHRDAELAKVSSNRSVAKVAFLKVAYGGQITLADDYYKTNDDGISPEGDTSLLKAIEGEMKHIVEHCWKENKNLHKMCNSRDHPKFSCFAYVLQTIECDCLLEIVRYMKSIGREVGVLIHDGCCIRKKDGETTLPDEVLHGAEQAIKDKFGYEIRLAVKPWNHQFEKDEHEEPLLDPSVLPDDAYAARKFCELMGDHLVYDNKELWVFNADIGMWSRDKATLERVITMLNGKLVFKQMGPKGVKVYDYSGCCEKTASLIRKLPSVAMPRDGYMRSRIHTDIGKLLFADGIYDFQTDTFTPEFDSSIVFTGRIPRPYPKERDEDKIAFIQKTSFEEPFMGSGDGKVMKHQAMRAFYGDFTRKLGILGIGPHDSSKGMFQQLATTGGGSYVASFNGNSLIFKHFNGESERDMTFVLRFCDARLAISSEIRMPSAESKTKVEIDANIYKGLVSGGDEHRARRLNENAQTIVNKAAVWILANEVPPFSPATNDTQEKLFTIAFSATFTKNPVEPNEKKADPDLAKKYKDSAYGDAFLHLLMDEYREWKAAGFPEVEMTELGRSGLDGVMSIRKFVDVLREGFVITKNPMDCVDFTEIEEFMRQQEMPDSKQKIGRELSALGLPQGKRKERGRQIAVRSGLRRKREDEE